MASWGLTYRILPIALLWDCWPIVGRLDDELAAGIVGAGGLLRVAVRARGRANCIRSRHTHAGTMLMILGYKFGTGDPPAFARAAVEAVQAILFVMRPLMRAWVGVPLRLLGYTSIPVSLLVKGVTVPVFAVVKVAVVTAKYIANLA